VVGVVVAVKVVVVVTVVELAVAVVVELVVLVLVQGSPQRRGQAFKIDSMVQNSLGKRLHDGGSRQS